MDLLYAKWYLMSTYLVLKTRLYIYGNLFWIEKAEAFFLNVRMNKKGHNSGLVNLILTQRCKSLTIEIAIFCINR